MQSSTVKLRDPLGQRAKQQYTAGQIHNASICIYLERVALCLDEVSVMRCFFFFFLSLETSSARDCSHRTKIINFTITFSCRQEQCTSLPKRGRYPRRWRYRRRPGGYRRIASQRLNSKHPNRSPGYSCLLD